MGVESSPKLSDSDLIDLIWREKRDKVLGASLPGALYIAIPTPTINIEDVANGVLRSLRSISPAHAFEWAQNWGKTRVVLGSQSMQFGFLNEKSKEARKFTKLHTIKPVRPGSRLLHSPQGRKYFIIINNEPSPIEGIVLQTERMVDELVWCLGLSFRRLVDDPVEAYSMALESVYCEGIDIYILEKGQILDLRRRDDRYQVRIYGNSNHRSKVPQVIGAVGPFDKCIPPPFYELCSQVTEQDSQPTAEKISLPLKPFLNMGICVAKRPHIGHMMLASVVEIARRSIGQPIPLIIHANDTGPRINQTIARVASRRNVTEADVLNLIAQGQIDSSEVDLCYRERMQVERARVVHAEESIRNRKSILPRQADEHYKIFSSFFGDSEFNQVVLESGIDEEFGPQDVLNSPLWYGTGTSFTTIGGKRYMLQSNGFLSASASRAATLNFSAQLINRGVPIYIDADQSITDSMVLLHEQVGIKGIQYPGAAIGFGMSICSGTGGDSILMAEFIDAYRAQNPETSLLEVIVYLTSTRYQLRSNNGTCFFDYANYEAFWRDVELAKQERARIRERALNTIRMIQDMTDSTLTQVAHGLDTKKARKLQYTIQRLMATNGVEDVGHLERIFLQTRTMHETPEVQSLIDKAIVTGRLSRKDATIHILTSIARGQIPGSSNIINELSSRGYKNEELIEAAMRFINGDFSFVRINSLLFNIIETIEEMVEQITALDPITGALVLERYKSSYGRLFNEDI